MLSVTSTRHPVSTPPAPAVPALETFGKQEMNHPALDLRQIPWIERRSRIKELKQRLPKFRSLCWQVQLIRLTLSALTAFAFYSFRDQLGIGAFLGFVAASFFIEWWLERSLLLPVANLYIARGTVVSDTEDQSVNSNEGQW